MKTSAKNKIYYAICVWLIAIFAVFKFGFQPLEASNKAVLDELANLKKEQAKLQAEEQSLNQAKSDLAKLSKKELQPGEFFSQDVTLVNEFRRLESIAASLGIEMNLSGVSGTVKTAAKANTKSAILQIPYGISLSGPLDKVVSFIEYLENLEYISSINSLNINANGASNINASLTAAFYLTGKK